MRVVRYGHITPRYAFCTGWVNGPAETNCVGAGHSWENKFVLFDEFHLAEV